MEGKINETLEKDTELRFPHIYSVEASAGSGKTYTLTLRVLQFLLSRRNIKNNNLTNILGITFTNNSAKEMKTQILNKLKSLNLGFLEADTIRYIYDITSFGGDTSEDNIFKNKTSVAKTAKNLAGNLIDAILSNYHDFQIRTIDSFTSKILKASAAEMELPPDFEISTESSGITDYAVLKMIESAEQGVLEKFLDLLSRNASWDGIDFNPADRIKIEMKRLLEIESDYNSEFLADFSFQEKLDENLKPAIDGLKGLLESAEKEDLEINGKFKRETIEKIKNYLNDKNYFGLVNDRKGFPYKNKKDYSEKWEELYDSFNGYMPEIAKLKSLPYLTMYDSFKKELLNAYKILGLVYISDVNKKLSRFLRDNSVPEVYFQLGNSIYHYFIDEFQDTSKVQWQNLKPLIEESLAKGGSLFTVGDLKQALYGFRGADYKIMKALNDGGGSISFPSIEEFKKVSLKFNYRSDKILVDYVNNVFKTDLKFKAEAVGDPAGFLTYEQDTPIDETGGHIHTGGYCFTEIFKKEGNHENNNKDGYNEHNNNDNKEKEENEPQGSPSEFNVLNVIEEPLLETIDDLVKVRNYGSGDIAILAQKNKYLNYLAGLLIEKGYKVVTQSSLDIRNRKIIREIEMLLNFLNSPIDDFNFGSFIIGNIFEKKIGLQYGQKYSREEFEKFLFETNLNNAKGEPLYVLFRERYEDLWNECFEELFNKTGYLPPYETALYLYKVFNIAENFHEESAYLAHFLDAVQYAEEKGCADLNDLLDLMKTDSSNSNLNAVDSDELFYIDLPEVKDAVTLLTVHKAKGLQWDAVINVFIAEENYALMPDTAKSAGGKGKKINYFVKESCNANANAADKDSFGDAECINADKPLNLFYITKSMFEAKNRGPSRSPYLESVYYDAVKDQNISDLNNLYVALTRAKHEMYNFIIAAEECPLPEVSLGEKKFKNSIKNESDENASVLENETAVLNCGYCDLGYEYGIKTGSQYLSIKRGDLYHKILSEIKYAEDFKNLDALIEKYMLLLRYKPAGEDFYEIKTDIKEKILRIKENDYLSKLFNKELCSVYTEKEYLSASGAICRMDRISIFNDIKELKELKLGEICILDYKTGHIDKKEKENYESQMHKYKSILKDLYKDKKISAIVYNIDGDELLIYE
ncbi:MAG: UvrD-helicase domain-containing protein [Candidatus Acidulodesulfobacterium sp.]